MIYHVVFQVSSKVIQLYTYMYLGFPLGSVVKESPYNEGDLSSIPGLGRYAQRDMTSLSSILAWGISWTEEPSRLQSIGSQRVEHNWNDWTQHTFIIKSVNQSEIKVNFYNLIRLSKLRLLLITDNGSEKNLKISAFTTFVQLCKEFVSILLMQKN